MKTKHTPGPWAFREGAEPHHQALVYSEESGHDVAVTYHDEGATNARLIAAAPELLDALQSITETLHQMKRDNTVSGMLYVAELAIQKATQP